MISKCIKCGAEFNMNCDFEDDPYSEEASFCWRCRAAGTLLTMFSRGERKSFKEEEISLIDDTLGVF